MTSTIRVTTTDCTRRAAKSAQGLPVRDCGLIARLGRDLYDLNDSASLTSETVGCSLMVGEMLAGLAR